MAHPLLPTHSTEDNHVHKFRLPKELDHRRILDHVESMLQSFRNQIHSCLGHLMLKGRDRHRSSKSQSGADAKTIVWQTLRMMQVPIQERLMELFAYPKQCTLRTRNPKHNNQISLVKPPKLFCGPQTLKNDVSQQYSPTQQPDSPL